MSTRHCYFITLTLFVALARLLASSASTTPRSLYATLRADFNQPSLRADDRLWHPRNNDQHALRRSTDKVERPWL
ncbi:MAG TPA: hypothetical protein VF600_14555 [Abditibacteriaceae bacterium]|jgi:hypothetical protein